MPFRPSNDRFLLAPGPRKQQGSSFQLSGFPALRDCRWQVAERMANLQAMSLHRERLFNLAQYLSPSMLYVAGMGLRRRAARGVDGVTPRKYLRHLASNITKLIQEVKHKSYQPKPSRQVLFDKDDGSPRPISLPTIRDKHLQRAVMMILEAIYEPHFYTHSYGFRPHRSGRMAVKVLMDWLSQHNGGWILEIDLSKFFDTIPHDQLLEVISQRIGDKVILHLILSWLKAGILVDGQVRTSDIGAPQGGVISPLCANVYMDMALDQWFVRELQPKLKGESLLVRYADDFVLAFNDQDDMESVEKAIKPRLEHYGLTVNTEKSRTVDLRAPEGDIPNLLDTHIDFLGFTYYWKPCPYSGWKLAVKTSGKSIKRFTNRLVAMVNDNGDIASDELEVAIQSMVKGHKGSFDVEGNEDMLDHIEQIAFSYLDLHHGSFNVEMNEATTLGCI